MAWAEEQQAKSYGGIANICTIDCAYTAGFLDGEGYVGFYTTKDESKRMQVTITNTNREIIYWIKKTFRVGRITFTQYKKKKDCYRFILTNNKEATYFLRLIFPYVMIKRRQVKMMIEWLETRIKCNHEHRIVERNEEGQILRCEYLDAYSERELEIMKEFETINRRGK